MKAAFHVARTGRCGPVLVDVPRDIQEAEIDFHYPAEVDLPGWKPPKQGHARQIREAAAAIAAADRPILYVGGGTLNGDATAELRELAEAARLPVITTLMGKSAFSETHELFFGWPGMHGPKWSNWALNKADLLVACGSRFDDRVTGKLSAFAPGARVIHLDIDAAEIGKLRHADIPVVGPLKQVLRDLAAESRKLVAESSGPTHGGLAPPDRRLAGRVPAALLDEGRLPEAADRRRDAARPHRRPGRRRLDDRGRPASDVGDAVRRVRAPADLPHIGRARDDGLRVAGRGRRQGGPPGCNGRVHRRRRLLPDDVPGARHRGAREPADRRRDHQQRLPRHGAAVAGHVLRRAALAGAPDPPGARLRAARRGVRRQGLHDLLRGRARRARRGARARADAHGRRRRPRRREGAVLPDDPRRCRRARSDRVRGGRGSGADER